VKLKTVQVDKLQGTSS